MRCRPVAGPLGGRPVVGLVLAGLVAASCSSAGAAGSSGARSGAADGTAGRSELTIYAAASLRGVLDSLRAAYVGAHPGLAITTSTGSSAALETQIEQGAPADLFLSADVDNARKLVVAGLAQTPVPFARNLLTVIVPANNPAGIRTPADLAGPGVRVVAAGDAVPITHYANQLVANLASQPGYPAGFANRYASNIVSKEDDVQAVVAKVELGEADAAIVYMTDAKASTKLVTIPVPGAANVPATYEGVAVARSAQPDAARAFLDWLAGPEGQAILGGVGFLPPP